MQVVSLCKLCTSLPNSQKIWRGIKFGGLVVFRRNRQIKIRQNLYRVHVCMAILFQTAKFKSANTQFGGKPPNLMTANISGYTVLCSYNASCQVLPIMLKAMLASTTCVSLLATVTSSSCQHAMEFILHDYVWLNSLYTQTKVCYATDRNMNW